MTASGLLEIRGLSKRFTVQRSWKDVIRKPGDRDVRTALDGVDLSIRKGEFFGLLGANGAGKTTLFKILATLILPDAGRVTIDGIDVVSRPAEVRGLLVPVIPNERSLYWRVSARENLRLYAALHGLSAHAARTRVDEALEVVDLSDAREKQVGLFSSGMKQRLLIARALLGRPSVLLLDEPTRSLDPVSARRFRAFLRDRVGRERGTTVLLATHDHEEVTELCDRVGVLAGGKILAEGPTEVVLAAAEERRYEIRVLRSADSPGRGDAHATVVNVARQFGCEVVHGGDTRGSDAHEDLLSLTIHGPLGEPEAAAMLKALVQSGLTVSRFSRSDLSLADLLERVAAGRSDAHSE